MLTFVRNWMSPATIDRAALRRRDRSWHTTAEALEHRCMLSIAPGAIDQLVGAAEDRGVRFDDIAIPTGGSFEFQLIDAIAGADRSGGLLVPIIDHVRNSGRLGQIEITIPRGNDGEFPSFPKEPGSGGDWSQAPSIPLPEDGDLGGFTEIGNHNEPMVDEKNTGPVDSIVGILAALRYQVQAWQADRAESSNELNAPADPLDAAMIVLPETWHDDADGGMVAILRNQPLQTPERATIEAKQSSTQTPVEMDQVRGKFQAFEISTSEEHPAPRPEAADQTLLLDAPTDHAEARLLELGPAPTVMLAALETAFATYPSFDVTAEDEAEASLVEPEPSDALAKPIVDPAAVAIIVLSISSALRTPRVRATTDEERHSIRRIELKNQR